MSVPEIILRNIFYVYLLIDFIFEMEPAKLLAPAQKEHENIAYLRLVTHFKF